MKITIEVRAAEGGNDAKLLVETQANIYQKYCAKHNLKVEIISESLAACGWNSIVLCCSGKEKQLQPLLKESGGHRWQRIPPTESKGRVHTSTVTVVVQKNSEYANHAVLDSDIKVMTTKDTGPGGQHRNKTESCVVMRHLPTGIEAKSAEKDQHRNRKIARELLEQRIQDHFSGIYYSGKKAEVKNLAGSGMRGDKVKTYREKDNQVLNHSTNTKLSLKDVLKGKTI